MAALWQDDTPTVPYVPALLRALISLDAEAVVLHPGDKPYIVAPTGPVELSSRPLTTRALAALLLELLPPATRATLESAGSVQWEMPADAATPAERFVVVAARVDDEPWVELRRSRIDTRDEQPPSIRPRAAEDSLSVPTAEEFWPSRADEDIDDSF